MANAKREAIAPTSGYATAQCRIATNTGWVATSQAGIVGNKRFAVLDHAYLTLIATSLYACPMSWANGDIAASKQHLRALSKGRRAALDERRRADYSQLIVERLLIAPQMRTVNSVMAYCSFGDELDTSALLSGLLASGKTLLLPRMESERAGRHADATDKQEHSFLQPYKVVDLENDLQTGMWGIRQPMPDRCPRFEADAIELIIMPGLAFTPQGDRLGYGRGYYDRLLSTIPAKKRPWLIAGAFETQIFASIPVERHDQHVHCIATEKRQLYCDQEL